MGDPREPAPQGPRPQLSGKLLPAWNAAIRRYWPPEFLNKQICQGDPVWGGVCRDSRVLETDSPQLDLGLCATARPFSNDELGRFDHFAIVTARNISRIVLELPGSLLESHLHIICSRVAQIV